MNILVAEDDPEIRQLLEDGLTTFRNLTIVENGGAALDAFDDAWKLGLPYDVILLDINMPDISGIEVLKNIRHLEKKKGIAEKMPAQVIMMTAISDKSTVVACLESGCNDYIIKPFNIVAVVDKLTKLDNQTKATKN